MFFTSFYIILYYIILFYIILFYSIIYCILLYDIILYYIRWCSCILYMCAHVCVIAYTYNYVTVLYIVIIYTYSSLYLSVYVQFAPGRPFPSRTFRALAHLNHLWLGGREAAAVLGFFHTCECSYASMAVYYPAPNCTYACILHMKRPGTWDSCYKCSIISIST